MSRISPRSVRVEDGYPRVARSLVGRVHLAPIRGKVLASEGRPVTMSARWPCWSGSEMVRPLVVQWCESERAGGRGQGCALSVSPDGTRTHIARRAAGRSPPGDQLAPYGQQRCTDSPVPHPAVQVEVGGGDGQQKADCSPPRARRRRASESFRSVSFERRSEISACCSS